METALRICPVCEAACGLRVQLDGRRVVEVRGNPADTFSKGHICPKGVALADLDADPRRLRTPLLRRDGRLEPCDWDTAYRVIGERLGAIRAAHGNDAVAVYIGNPTAHNVGLSLGIGPVIGALATRNVFTAASVDQLPKQLACELMFGDDMAIPVPDIERCDCLLMLGANPIVSNGSLWMVPDIRGKLADLHRRGGSFVVVDPRRTETARLADSHLAIRPGSDAFLLAAVSNALRARGRDVPERLRELCRGAAPLFAALANIDAATAARHCGIAASDIDALADRLHRAQHPVVYGRIGTTLQRFGTLVSHLVEVLNVQLDVLDREGGAVFPEQPFSARPGRYDGPLRQGRWHSRVGGHPEVLGQMPALALAEEMETAGTGQIRALITLAGNPVLSTPDSARLARAVDGLEFRVAVDIYLTDATRRADVVLPGTSPFEDSHYDHFLGGMTYRNTARYSAPVFATDGRPDEWRVMLGLAFSASAGRAGSDAELDALEDNLVARACMGHIDDADGPLHGADLQTLLADVGPKHGVERLLDVGIRAGRWGDAFGKRPGGLTLQHLIDTPDSLDLGPPQPRLAKILAHARGSIDLAPAAVLADIGRLRGESVDDGALLLIGRRNIQTNNSWLHGLPTLAKGPPRCVLEMHPSDAAVRAISDGQAVRVSSRAGALEVAVKLSDDLRPGVVCMPHGFEAANSNVLAPTDWFDPLSVTAALNGIPVEVAAL